MQVKKIIKLVVGLSVFAVLPILGGCASSMPKDFFSVEPDKDYSNMYLRGVFNWWEANEGFKLVPMDEETYSATIELIADGQPYDFKVADATWTMALNCGSQYLEDPMFLNDAVELNCEADSLNLQFTPKETGNYRFVLDVSDNNEPELLIVRIE